MTTFVRLLRDRRKGFQWWVLGTVIGIAATVALWPTIEGNPDFEKVVEQLPASLRAMIGSQAGIALTSAAGYLQARLFSTLLPVLLLVYAISLGAAAIGGAEEDGTLQLVVTAPVSRRQIAVERVGASLTLVALLAMFTLISILAFGAPVGLLDDLSSGRVAVAMWAVLGLALLHGAIAFFVGAVTGRRGSAVAVAAAFAVAGYVVNAVAAVAPTVEPLRVTSPWWWLLDHNLLVQSATVAATVIPFVAAIALGAGGVAVFSRRDLRLP